MLSEQPSRHHINTFRKLRKEGDPGDLDQIVTTQLRLLTTASTTRHVLSTGCVTRRTSGYKMAAGIKRSRRET